MKENKIITIILSFLILSGFILRILSINWGLPSKNGALTTFNPDEAVSYYTIEKWDPKNLKFPAGVTLNWGAFHQLTLAGMLKLSQIVGYTKFGNRQFYIENLNETDKLYIVGRLIGIVCGTVSIFLIYLLLIELFDNKKIGIISAALLTILPLHIINSLYIRPDVMLMMFMLFVLIFSAKIMNKGDTEYYVLTGIFLGFATATKYIGGSYIFIPFLAHTIRHNWKVNLLSKPLWIMYILFIVCFVIGCPYSILDINSFIASIRHNLGLANWKYYGMPFYLPTWWRYFTWYLPLGIGIPVLISSIIGFISMFFKIEKPKIFIVISSIIIFIFITRPSFSAVWHTLPIIPFLLVYSGYFVYILSTHKSRVIKIGGTLISIGIVIYTTIYSFAYVNLLAKENVREEASQWIDKNIPKTMTIGIARSYFWTPPILRQYNPPYRLLMGAPPVKSSVEQGVLGLEKIMSETDYLVLTEYEYRIFFHSKLRKICRKQTEVLQQIFSGEKFIKIAEFNKEAKFLWFTFKKNYPPFDWLIPNPEIIVFKKI